MKVPFIIEIDRIQSIDSIYLGQGEYSDILNQYLNNGIYNLYYLTYVNKYRFNINHCEIENNRLIIRFLNNECEIIPDLEILSIVLENSSTRNIYVTTNIGPLNLTINEVLTNWGSNIHRNQEIQYIGQSRNIGNRLGNHEKLIQTFAAAPDDKEVLINFVKPSFGYTDIENNQLIHFDKGTLMQTKFQNFNYQQLIDLTERVLVKFYQPKLNINFLNTDFTTDRTIQGIIQIAQNEIFIISCIIEDEGYNFQSENQILNSNTFILDRTGNFQEYEE